MNSLKFIMNLDWKQGSMEAWRHGSMEAWKHGECPVRTIENSPGRSHGIK